MDFIISTCTTQYGIYNYCRGDNDDIPIVASMLLPTDRSIESNSITCWRRYPQSLSLTFVSLILVSQSYHKRTFAILSHILSSPSVSSEMQVFGFSTHTHTHTQVFYYLVRWTTKKIFTHMLNTSNVSLFSNGKCVWTVESHTPHIVH